MEFQAPVRRDAPKITVRLAQLDHQRLGELAEAEGVSPSQWLLHRIRYPAAPAMTQAQVDLLGRSNYELAGLGRDLNQVARSLNAYPGMTTAADREAIGEAVAANFQPSHGASRGWAWLIATCFSGIPSTLHALLTDADALEATRGAGAMLIDASSPGVQLIAAAAVVHPVISAFWTLVFGVLLPSRGVVVWAVLGSAVVAWLDLRVIAPLVFPSVAALPFWPQFADHLMWGLLVGATLAVRRR